MGRWDSSTDGFFFLRVFLVVLVVVLCCSLFFRDTVVRTKGACDPVGLELIRNDIGRAAKGAADKIGAPTLLVSSGRIGTECQACFKTKVDVGKAEEMSDKIVATKDLGKKKEAKKDDKTGTKDKKDTKDTKDTKTTKGAKRLLLQSRQLEGGATSTSSSPTQEEVAESDQASDEDYSGAGIKASVRVF